MGEKKIHAKELVEYYRTMLQRRTGGELIPVYQAKDQILALGETILGLVQTGKNVGIQGLGTFRLQKMGGFKAQGLAKLIGASDIPPRKILRFCAAEKAKNI